MKGKGNEEGEDRPTKKQDAEKKPEGSRDHSLESKREREGRRLVSKDSREESFRYFVISNVSAQLEVPF